MGMGLGALGAAAGAGQGLEKLLAERRAEQLMQQNGLSHLISLESLMQNRAASQADQAEKIQMARDKAIADAAAKADALKQRNAENVDRVVGTFSPGQLIPMERYQELSGKGGDAFPKDLFSEQAGIGAPSLQAGDVGPTAPGGMKYGGAFSQLQKIKEDEGRSDQNDAMNAIRQQLADAASQRAQSGPQSSYQLTPEVDPKTGIQTGNFSGYNTKANRFEPIGGPTPKATKAAPGAGQASQHEQAKKDALGSLDQLDQAIDAAAPFVGPGAGRVSKLEQLVGNPNPAISALGTKLLLTKMQVDHAAAGTVRAGASPQILSRWDNLLSQHLDPQNLKASVQAMREILGGGASGGGLPKVGDTFNGGKVLSIEKVP